MIYCCNDIFLALNLCHNGHASVRGVICAVGDDDFAEGCDLGALPTEEVGRGIVYGKVTSEGKIKCIIPQLLMPSGLSSVPTKIATLFKNIVCFISRNVLV